MNTKVDEGKLISGKEALIALANGEEVQIWNGNIWWDVEGDYQVNVFLKTERKFRLKQRTIKINGIEVPAPFEPKEDCLVYIIDDGKTASWRVYGYEVNGDATNPFLGLWRTEEEIKQVVSALRQVFSKPTN